MSYCIYFQALVEREKTWFLTASLRSFEYLCFDRTIDKKAGRFEFFVPPDLKGQFLEVMDYFQKEGIVKNLQEIENRLRDPAASV
jgi:hypothetical protein